MPEENDIANGRIGLSNLSSTISVIDLINENGDLCKDGLRAVNFMNHLGNQLIDAIEADEGVKGVADELHKTTNQIKHEKETRRTADPA